MNVLDQKVEYLTYLITYVAGIAGGIAMAVIAKHI
jgi:hypothetical protein